MQVIGDNHHNTTCGNTHKKGEIGDVKSPGDVPAHARDLQTVQELINVGDGACAHYGEQKDNPQPIFFTSLNSYLKHSRLS